MQQELGHGFGQLVAVGAAEVGERDRFGGGYERPATGRGGGEARSAREAREAADVGGALAAGHPGADGAEAVGHHQAAGHAVPQGALDVFGQPVGGRAELGGEARAALAQHLEHLGGRADAPVRRDRRRPVRP